jgi:hypothetical protein
LHLLQICRARRVEPAARPARLMAGAMAALRPERTRIPEREDIMPYHHTQPGVLIVAVCIATAAIFVAAALLSGQWLGAVVFLIVLGALAALFSSLTVDVNGSELRWYFGPGLWRYQLPLTEVETVAVVRNHWWNGFGIRMAPGRRLYNVSGLDAVELRLKSGEVRRIGTDDPQGLSAALQAGLAR